jgi:diaminopimelate decarboxylase
MPDIFYETLVVDAPYTNFARPFVYHTNHRVRCIGKGGIKRRFIVRGCSINSKDYLSHKEFAGDVAELPVEIREGDLLCFRDVGAYSPVMQMDFLHYAKAPTILLNAA